MFTGMSNFGAVAYVLILVSAVVFTPMSVMPVIPIVTSVFGALETVLLSVTEWAPGAGVAFLISRHLGRPILEKITPIENWIH